MNSSFLIEEITLNDLNDRHRKIAKTIGLDKFIKLIKDFGGTRPFIPSEYSLIKEEIYKKIAEEYPYTTIEKLIAKYDISQNTIYSIIEKYNIPPKAKLLK